jgi:hypothetical protein
VDNKISCPAGRADDLGIVDGLVQLSTLVQAVLSRAADSLGLSVLQARLLGVLRDREPTMAELGRLLDLDKSSTYRPGHPTRPGTPGSGPCGRPVVPRRAHHRGP